MRWTELHWLDPTEPRRKEARLSLSTDPLKWLNNAMARGNAVMLRERTGQTLDALAAQAAVPARTVETWEKKGTVTNPTEGLRYAQLLAGLAGKTCAKCAEWRAANQFWITRAGTSVRLHARCNACRSEHAAERWQLATREFKDSEAERVRVYQQDPAVKQRRAKRSSAQYRALAKLRETYWQEFQNLRGTGSTYSATAELRERHPDTYARIYRGELDAAGLDA